MAPFNEALSVLLNMIVSYNPGFHKLLRHSVQVACISNNSIALSKMYRKDIDVIILFYEIFCFNPYLLKNSFSTAYKKTVCSPACHTQCSLAANGTINYIYVTTRQKNLSGL